MIKPLGKRITVRPAKTPTKVGSLYIPEIARVNLLTAKILAVGEEVLGLSPGDIVIYQTHSGRYVEKDILMLLEEDIIGKLEEENHVS